MWDDLDIALDLPGLFSASGLSPFEVVLLCLVGMGRDGRFICEVLHMEPKEYRWAVRKARIKMRGVALRTGWRRIEPERRKRRAKEHSPRGVLAGDDLAPVDGDAGASSAPQVAPERKV